MRTVDLVEDIEWMRDSGESPHMAVARLGMSAGSVERALQRAERRDLAAWVQPAKRVPCPECGGDMSRAGCPRCSECRYRELPRRWAA